MRDKVKKMSEQKVNRVGALINSSGKITSLTVALVGVLSTSLVAASPLASGKFFLCTMLGSGSTGGLRIKPKNVLAGLILGAPVIGLVAGMYQYFKNAGKGDPKLKDIWQPAVIGLAVPVMAVLLDGATTVPLSCLWTI